MVQWPSTSRPRDRYSTDRPSESTMQGPSSTRSGPGNLLSSEWLSVPNHSEDIRAPRSNSEGLRTRLIEAREFVVVTDVIWATATTVLISNGDGAKIELRANGNVGPAELSLVNLDARLASSTSRGWRDQNLSQRRTDTAVSLACVRVPRPFSPRLLQQDSVPSRICSRSITTTSTWAAKMTTLVHPRTEGTF